MKIQARSGDNVIVRNSEDSYNLDTERYERFYVGARGIRVKILGREKALRVGEALAQHLDTEGKIKPSRMKHIAKFYAGDKLID